MSKLQRVVDTTERLKSKFKHFEIYDPSLIEHIETKVDIDYFPRGNDAYIQNFVEVIKEYINKRIK